MSLTIHPDPQEPAGGYAFLEWPGGTLGDGPVRVAVMEVYGERWLADSDGEPGGKVAIGEAHWQGERHEFGPYDVHRHDGADWVRIGPEIVNKIDEYTPLRIAIGGQVADVTWPDDVPPRAGAAVLGGLRATARTPQGDATGVFVGKPPSPEPEPAVKSPPDPVEVAEPIEAAETAVAQDHRTHRRKLMGLILLVLALLMVGVAVWGWVARDEPVVAQVDLSDPCALAALEQLDGFGATAKAIRTCGDVLSPDTVLKLVEDATAKDDAEALLLFGTLYDGGQNDRQIEQVIGLSFDHDATRAVEYYARAVAAGSQVAIDRLSATCTQLADSNETLAKGAFDDFCR
jgi:hypothetical protein